MNLWGQFVDHINFSGMDHVSTNVLVTILPLTIRRGPGGKQFWSVLLVTRRAFAALAPNRTNVSSANPNLI